MQEAARSKRIGVRRVRNGGCMRSALKRRTVRETGKSAAGSGKGVEAGNNGGEEAEL